MSAFAVSVREATLNNDETLHFKELDTFETVWICGVVKKEKGGRSREVPKRLVFLSSFILLSCAFSGTC